MEALLLALDAVLVVWLLISVKRCEGRLGKQDLGFFSYVEEALPSANGDSGAPEESREGVGNA